MTGLGLRACWTIARRDLHARLRGLRLLFICLFLGVATLATIGSLTAAITSELQGQGQSLLGGDIEIAMTQREATDAEKSAFRALGAMSETIRTRAMVSSGAEGRAILTELKGVDGAYPLYGMLRLRDMPAPETLAPDEVFIDEALAARLNVRPGNMLRYGEATFRVRDIITEEPDRVGEGFTFGPVALTSLDGLRRTGLLQPGSLYESKYRVRLPSGADPKAATERLEAQFSTVGLELRDRDNAAPGASRFISRMGQFLSLIGLAALIIAGIGVSNGVSSYLAMKRNGIATLKILGASSGDIARIYMMQIGMVAALAVAFGLATGAVLPLGIIAVVGDALPVQPGAALYPIPLATSAAYGLLIAFIFTLPPLARARTLPAAALFRSVVEQRFRIDRRTSLSVGGAAAALLALILLTARDPLFAGMVVGATVATVLILAGIGWAVKRIAGRLPRARRPLVRLAVANLHRPGAQTVPLVIALGLGLTLFVMLAAIQTSITSEITRTVPQKAPDQFVLDIPANDSGRFQAIVRSAAPKADINLVPNLRGTITAYGEQRVADLEELPEGGWFLRGERGVTYSDALPRNSDLVAGQWWPRNYAGPPLVSLDQNAAEVMQVGIGDTLTVSVLGREIDARIASLRKVNWDSLGLNYVLVLSPNALAGAPHTYTATISLDGADQGALTRALLAAFPAISIIDVGELIGEVVTILDQMSVAIALAGSITILAGIAVLIGAIAASRQSRSYDSVILKTLGATRRQVLAAQAMEYALLAILLAVVAMLLGTVAAYSIVVWLFEFGWAPDWIVVLLTLGAGAVLTLAIGLIGSIPIMSVRPASALRQLHAG
ncbi:ABC transporter permease [Allosphingosinicella flava]|uniref:ABC transporter permease n=1 Tax=Allosphingosinicella flava TaxID=2771430 RepID=A0A7T2GKI6_9SPHN|nr:FtsX-like permease family protein [Sphingosinicella flava]QPQ55203.1 ABC transporter permease [Sphingosinicella flava]